MLGKLVKIDDIVWDSGMGPNRVGLVVELVGKKKDQVMVMFLDNQNILKFHESQVTEVILPELKS